MIWNMGSRRSVLASNELCSQRAPEERERKKYFMRTNCLASATVMTVFRRLCPPNGERKLRTDLCADK